VKRANELEALVRPFVERLAAELATEIVAHVDRVLATAVETTLEKARADLAKPPPTTQASTVVTFAAHPVESTRERALAARRIVKKALAEAKPKKAKPTLGKAERKARIVKSTEAMTVRGKPRQRSQPKCGNCGAVGYRSDGCGRTHNKPAADSDDEEGEDVVSADLADAGLRLAAPMIVFADLPASIALDDPAAEETEDDVDGNGNASFPTLPGAGRDLVALSPLDRREVCPIHGWVGRLGFQAGRHEACVLEVRDTNEPCRSCGGQKIVVAGGFCRRCNGFGIEPPDAIDSEDDDADADEVAADPDDGLTSTERRDVERGARTRRDRGTPRSITIAQKVSDDRAGELLGVDLSWHGADVEEMQSLRPRTRGECVGTARPCPWVGCRHHLFLDVNEDTGGLKINFPDRSLDDLAETCALDVADRGVATLEAVGELMNLTRERTRQVEVRGLIQLQRHRKAIS
jgi:hypothetical protein